MKNLPVTEKKKRVCGLDRLIPVKRRCKCYCKLFSLMKGNFIGLIHNAAKLGRRYLVALSPVNRTGVRKKDFLRGNRGRHYLCFTNIIF